MRTALSVLLLTIALLPGFAQPKQPVNITYGVKGGFSSTIYEVQQLSVMHQPITEHTAHSEISSFYTAFMRLNINRHYLQTECSYNISRYSLSFSTNQWDPNAGPQEQSSITTKIESH